MNTLSFCSVELAERVERAEAQMITTATEAARRGLDTGAQFVIPLAGGAACYAENDSPLNKIVGLGFGGVPSVDTLDEIARAFASHAAATNVELANLADPAIGAALTSRGFKLVSFENVLGRFPGPRAAACDAARRRGPAVRRPRCLARCGRRRLRPS
jgi:hypothetical protein